jgi:two-component system cell cycle response regulator DivK
MLGDESRQPATPRRILIVEDNELNLKLLADLLEYHGYGIKVTGLGEAAVDLTVKEHPDLILLDIKLPDIVGTEVAARLKADPRTREIPIIAVTAYAMQGDRGDILASGCDEYVPKPIRIPEFLELVARYLDPFKGRTSSVSDRRSGRDRRQRSSDRRVGERRVSIVPRTGSERRSGRDRRQGERRNITDRRMTAS